MSRVFLISDHHLGHNNVLKFGVPRVGRTIYEHNEWLVAMHNSRVTKRDTVWFLGDVAFSLEVMPILERMRGDKRLILGNHDNFELEIYQQYFSKVKAIQPYKGGVLTHVPIHSSSLDRWKTNWHGHIHSKDSPSGRHINCCVEKCDGVPRTLEEWAQ